MVAPSGRALAEIWSSALTLNRVHALGWEADDLDSEVLMPYRDFASLEEAKATAERDLPAGTTVHWATHDRALVETREELVDALRERLEWLVELGREDGFDPGELEAGRRHAVKYEYDGRFQALWRDAVREGIAAFRERPNR
jgi:hypothetical protein